MKNVALLSCLLLLAACGSVPRGGGYYEDDGPHDRPHIDISKIPDAVPKAEPLAATGNKPYTVFGVGYRPLASARGYRERGVASWYGKKFHGKRTSSGEAYDMYAMTAAHKTLPIPSYVRVRNLQNGRSVVVRVNDRGPFLHNRVIDLSYAAAARLDILATGTGLVEVEAIDVGAPATTTARAVQIIPMAEAAEPQAEALAAPKLAVQVGAFTQADNAQALRTKLEQAGLPVYVQPPTDGGPSLYRVRLGPIDNVEQGDHLVAEAARQGITDAVIVVE
ncbi:MAG: septal ring lytic transglycosylase RlpA family protein [Gammaproteobacteria bacterium]